MFSSIKSVLSETHFLQKKNKEALNSSSAGNFGDTTLQEDSDEQLDLVLTGISRLDSSRNESDQETRVVKSEVKRLSLCSPNFFALPEDLAADNKLPKKPLKKSLRVSEQDSQGFILDPKKVITSYIRQTQTDGQPYIFGTSPTSTLRE